MRTLKLALLSTMGVFSVAFAQNAAPVPSPAPPDTLEFTNGNVLSGKLERVSGGNVVFSSEMAGELSIPFSKIKTLKSGSEFVALKMDDRGRVTKQGSGNVEFQGTNVVLTPAAGGAPQTLASKDLSYLVDVSTYARAVDHHASWKEGWTGAATAGLTLVRATQRSTVFTGDLNLVRAIPIVPYLRNRNRTIVNVSESYGTSSTPVIPQTAPPSPEITVKTNIFHADAERDEYFTPRLYGLADAAFDHNYAQGLQFQQLYGAGVGWTAIQNEREQLDLRGDIHYERQQFVTVGNAQTINNIIGSTFQENYHRTLPLKLVFTEWANILPAWNNTSAYTANAYVGLALPVYKRLAVNLSATDNYLNNPPVGYKKNSVQLVTGLTYAFK